jgi:glutaredoxin
LRTFLHVIIYSRTGCHLCEEAKKQILLASRSVSFTLEEVNIDSDLLLLDRYRYDIPVVAINDVDVFKHRVSADQLIDALGKLLEKAGGNDDSMEGS